MLILIVIILAVLQQAENILYLMGCAPVQKQTPLQRRDSPIGILKVTIIGVQIHQGIKDSHPQLKLRVSNQHFATNSLPPMVKETKAGDSFIFAINSYYKPYGRTIEIGYFSGDKLLSFGAVDANPLLNHKNHQDFRCILSDKQIEKGFVLINAVFQPLPSYDLTFRFQNATIRRKTGTCGEDNVAVRLTIGQEVLQTEYQQDALQKPPTWADKKYNFKVPQGISKGFLELVDDRGAIIGDAQLNLNQFQQVKVQDEIIQSQSLYFTEKGVQIIAADLKYTFILGTNPSFKPRTEMFTSAIRSVRNKNQFQTSLDKSRST